MPHLILVRHGQSEWNLERRFTGWVDVDLTGQGKLEACKSGEFIKEIKINITYALFTYVLMIASIIFINIPFIESKITKTDSKNEIIKKSLLYSGLLGLCIYGIYSGTNLAVFENYDIGLGLKDTLWGFILYTIVTTTYFLIA